MVVLKSNGNVYGAQLTAAERKALRIELQKEMADIGRRDLMELDAIILWELHEQLGLGPKSLKRFYTQFNKELMALCDRYEMHTEADKVWLCTHKLKEYGIDLEEWEKESEENGE